MTPFTLFLNTVLATGTIAALAGTLGLLFFIFSRSSSGNIGKSTRAFFHAYGLWTAFAISLVASIGSLLYSEAVGFLPCVLCWYQRIALYPQVILFGIAASKKDYRIVEYVLPLSVVGATIAAYHYYGQIFNSSALPCPVISGAPSCSQVPFIAFGFITIPMMALSVFILLIALSLFLRKHSRA